MPGHLETDRLVLRRLTPADLDDLVALDSDPQVMRYLTGGRPTPPEQIRDEVLPRLLAYYERGDDLGYWAVAGRDTGGFLGWIFLRPRPDDDGSHEGIELGYRLARAAWGRGYATEACRALVRKAFTQLRLDRVYAETMAVNTASRRVMEKAGLRYVRTFHPRWPDPIPGAEHGEVEYAVSRTEWQRAGQSRTQ